MCGYKKIKIEYIMMAVAFASVVWSIFAGFRISRFQWLFVMGSVVWFLGMCRLLDQNKRNIVVMVVICIIYCMLAHRQLINGFQIINNKMAEALNQSMDLGFYYYISVTLEHSRRDSVLAVLFFVLVAGIVLGILRCRPLTLFLTTGLMEMAVLMIAPYGISAAFFLFLGSWIVYFSIRKGKKGFAAGLYIMFLAAAVPLFFYDQTNVPTDTMIKRNILIQIREWTQGKGYLAVGGIGNGKLRSVGEVSPKGEKLFLVYAPENADLYLKGFVSGRYKDGEWTGGIEVSWKAFSFGSDLDSYRVAKLQEEQEELRETSTKENIEINVRSAYLNVLSLEKQIASQSKALEVAKVNFELNQEKYDAGLISTVDYLDFENTYRQARIAYNKVLLDYYYAFETYRSLLI